MFRNVIIEYEYKKTNIYMAGYCTLLTQTFNSTPFPDQKVAFKYKLNKPVPQSNAFILNFASAASNKPQHFGRLIGCSSKCFSFYHSK